MKKKVIIATILGTISVGAIALIITKAMEPKPVLVQYGKVTKGDVLDYLSTSGVIKSENYKDFYGPQGKVKKIHVEVGDEVSEGDVLMEFDITDLKTNVTQAEIQYNNAILSKDILVSNNKSINSKISELNSEIYKLDKRISALESLDDDSVKPTIAELQAQRKALVQSKSSLSPISSEQFKQADNAIALAKSNLDAAKNAASKVSRVIKADFDGVVTHIYTSVDAMSNGVQPVCTVQDIDDLKMLLSVGKYDSKLISLGQSAELTVDNNTITGEVSFISPVASNIQGEAVLSVDVTLDGFDENLKIDFTEDIDILVNEARDTLRVPMESIKYLKDGSTVVYVIRENTVKEVKVEIGVESDTYVEIKKGLKLGDKVVLTPGDDIKNNTLVTTNNGEV